jgi:hypothetical protein
MKIPMSSMNESCGVFMRQLALLIFSTLFFASCSHQKITSEARDPSSLGDITCEGGGFCVNQSVIAYYEKKNVGSIPYVGRIKTALGNGLYEIDNETSCDSCTIKSNKIFKEVKCIEGICSGERAVDWGGKEYEVRAVFANGDVAADQGNVVIKTFLRAKDLHKECTCLDGACKYDMVMWQGKRMEIERIYKNGMVGITSKKIEHTLKSLGFPSECTNESPCSCTR